MDASILTNSVLKKKFKIRGHLQFYASTGSVLFIASDMIKIQLLKLSSQAEETLYFWNCFWLGCYLVKTGDNFSSDCQTWEKHLAELRFTYKMEYLHPIQRSILLSDVITAMPVTSFNSLGTIPSLLDVQWLMPQENYFFSFKEACAIQMETDVRGDLNQS